LKIWSAGRRGAESIGQRAQSEGQKRMGSYSFRFEKLDIWKKAIEIGMELFDRLAPRARSAAARQNARPGGRGGFTGVYSSKRC